MEDKKIEAEFDKLSKTVHIPRPPKQWHIYNYLFTSFLITGFSLGLRLTNKYIENEKQRKELEKERLNSELAFLKNQISPHFFFNTLNNIYSLVQINTDDAQKSILKLSKLMRYLLYETEHGNIQLSQEIEFMKNYIDLMKLRLTQKVDLKVVFPDQYSDTSIPPLLFIPFVENALKHGISYRGPSFVHILMEVNDREIVFTCTNSIVTKTENSTDSGIGLENIKKRLALLFPQSHSLNMEQTDTSFHVQLTIYLKPTV
jgi:LytS/YehU family sensor histidine kinase